MIAAGASKAADGVVKVMPRLPRGWNVHVSGLHVWGGDGATIDYRVDYPRGSRQRAVFRVTDRGDLRALKFRAVRLRNGHGERPGVPDRTVGRRPLGMGHDRCSRGRPRVYGGHPLTEAWARSSGRTTEVRDSSFLRSVSDVLPLSLRPLVLCRRKTGAGRS